MIARAVVAVLVMLVGHAAAATAAERASTGPLALRAPDRLVLGRDARAVITLAATDRVPTLVASVGTIEPPTRGVDGRLAAIYQPPPRGVPSVAVIGALDPESGELLDWIAIPLYAEAQVAAKVDRAAEVVLHVADITHGPFFLRAREGSLVPVLVPPGVADAEMVAVDRAGRTTRRRLPLGVPPLERVLAVCPRDGASLTIVVATSDGASDAVVVPVVQASAGRLAAPRAIGRGVYRATFTAPERIDRLEATLGAAIGGAGPSRCVAPIRGEAPTAVTVAAARRRGVAPGAAVAIEVVLGFAGQRPPADVAVELVADRGAITGVRRIGFDRVAAIWTAPAERGGASIVTARSGTLLGRASIELEPVAIVAPRPPPPRFAIAVHGGYLTNFAGVAAPLIGAAITTRVGWPRLRAGVGLGYYASSHTAMTTGGEAVAIAIDAVPVLARVTLDLPPSRAGLFVGAAVGAMLGHTTLSSPSAGRVVESLRRPALGGFGGAAVRVGPGRLVLELGYLHATADGAAHGGLGGYTMTGGYRLAL